MTSQRMASKLADMSSPSDVEDDGRLRSPGAHFVEMPQDGEGAATHHGQMIDGGNEDEEQDHRQRFLSGAERLLSQFPQEAHESLVSLEMADRKKWDRLPIHVIAKTLDTDTRTGISTLEAERRLVEHGPNVLEEDARAPLYVVFLLQFYNLIIMLLLLAAIASFFLDKKVEGTAILFIVVLNACIATAQENSATNALEALAKMASPQCTVIRNAQQQRIDGEVLVPGDIVVLTTGDVVPADIRLFHAVDLKVNEMLLTGESEEVAKRSKMRQRSNDKLTADNMVFSSTTITCGNAFGIVVETGMTTRIGAIAELLKSKQGDGVSKRSWNPLARCVEKYQPKLTPLQQSLNKLGFLMGTIAMSVCAMVFAVGMIRGIRDPQHPDRSPWLVSVMVAVSLAVSAVPEGLPMVVTICLSVGTSLMSRKNVLVRKLAAVETLGAASVVCTDKTGTLTEGKMTAVKVWGDFKVYDVTGKGFAPEGGIFLNGEPHGQCQHGDAQLRATLLASVLCSNTQLIQEEVDGVKTWSPMGNSTEAALVVAAAKAGIWKEDVTDKYPRVVEVPFSSERKMMITVHVLGDDGMFDEVHFPSKPKYVTCVKGAPNQLVEACSRYCRTDGTIGELTSEQRRQVMRAVDDLSSQALRVLAVGYQELPNLPFAPDDDIDDKFAALSRSFVLLGLVASIDPERDGVQDSIATARNASIRTVMITGDYLKTAIAIAKNISLLQPGVDASYEAKDCAQLRPHGEYLPASDIDEITSGTLVFARARPEDKIEIVKSLQRQGLVVAMTGDGVNDAPALKEADIGVAMGLSGTEVAKNASDMVLLDDNFCSIISAIERGRVIYLNIQKFVIFLLSTNVGEIILIFSAVASGMPFPLQALQILILNLFTDGMPGAALSMEQGDGTVMDEKPRPKKQKLIHGRLWLLVGANAVFIASGVIAVFLLGVHWNFGKLFLDDILHAGIGAVGTDFRGITCDRWEGLGNGWKVYGNCEAQDASGMYVFPDLPRRDEFSSSTMYCRGGDYSCMSEGIARAQTMTFIAMTLTESLRAFTIRNMSASFVVGLFSNKHLLAAVLASILLTIAVTNIPVVNDRIFGFAPISLFHWVVAIGAPLHAVFWAEMLKWGMRRRDRKMLHSSD